MDGQSYNPRLLARPCCCLDYIVGLCFLLRTDWGKEEHVTYARQRRAQGLRFKEVRNDNVNTPRPQGPRLRLVARQHPKVGVGGVQAIEHGAADIARYPSQENLLSRSHDYSLSCRGPLPVSGAAPTCCSWPVMLR